MSFKFAHRKTRAEKTEESLEGLSVEEREHALAYRDRARQERMRFVKATDTEFWLCLCFRSMEELENWRKAFGFGDMHGFARYAEVKDGLGVEPERQSGVSFGSGPTFGAGPSFGKGPSFDKASYDPLADVKYENNLENDCLAELEALYGAFLSAKPPENMTDVTDSDIWTVLVFQDRDAKDAFISEAGSSVDQQDKYVDASKLATHLGVAI